MQNLSIRITINLEEYCSMIATSYIGHEQLKLEHSKVMLLEETHESSSVQLGVKA